MAEIRPIAPGDHSRPIGKYSPGIVVSLEQGDRMLFISGQVAADENGAVVGVGCARTQAEFVFKKLETIAREAGGSLANLVSVVIYLKTVSDFEAVSIVRNRVLSDPPPASTLVEVSSLAIPEHLVEISAVAVVPGRLP